MSPMKGGTSAAMVAVGGCLGVPTGSLGLALPSEPLEAEVFSVAATAGASADSVHWAQGKSAGVM